MKSKIKQIRVDLLRMGLAAGANGSHLGGSMSLVEVMAALYFDVMNFEPQNPIMDNRDRLIFSKGHGVMAQYAALKQLGLVTELELDKFKTESTTLYAHPSMNPQKGIEFSSGSLGQGLSLGVGVALALKRKDNLISRTFVILGDGECNEGSVWEAAMSAAHFRLNNLIAIVDKNDLQYDGWTSEIQSMYHIGEKWRSFGWEVVEADGHDVGQVIQGLKTKTEKPLVLLAQTVKGKGISFMENNPQWHNGVLTKRLFEQAMGELESANA